MLCAFVTEQAAAYLIKRLPSIHGANLNFSYEIAFSLANNTLCFLLGAGFSKQITAQTMPSWPELLNVSTVSLSNQKDVQSQILEMQGLTVPLEDCAQVLDLAFTRENKSFREAIASEIIRHKADKEASAITRKFFLDHPLFTIITTNYDHLVEDDLIPKLCVSNYPGKPVTISSDKVEVFHIHGSVKHPDSILTTTSDYYEFINHPSYFARKVFTLMAERTVVILGYSLADPNLRSLLYAYKKHNDITGVRGDIIYVSHKQIPQYLRDHYEAAFGVCVVDNISIDVFFTSVENRFTEAKEQVVKGRENLEKVLAGKHHYADNYLKSNNSLNHILAVATEMGIPIASDAILAVLERAIKKKIDFTGESGAWEQYRSLANWLTYLGALLKIRGTTLELTYLKAVQHSMANMSGKGLWGKSWAAFNVWQQEWPTLTFDNRVLVTKFMKEHPTPESDSIVGSV